VFQRQLEACKAVSYANSTGKRVIARGASVGRRKGTCRSTYWERYGKALAGNRLFSWYVDIEWCYWRGRITFLDVGTRPDVRAPLWSFDKRIAYRRSGGVGSRTASVFAQGKFELCVTKLGCIQQKQPWLRVVVNGDGTSSFRSGGT